MATTGKKMTDDPIVRRIVGLLQRRRKTERELTEFLGLSSGAVSKWKYYGSTVYLKYIDYICEFLDTTPNYLFWGPVDEEERLTPTEKEMIWKYRSLDEGRKKCIQDTLMYITKGSEKNMKKKVVEDE